MIDSLFVCYKFKLENDCVKYMQMWNDVMNKLSNVYRIPTTEQCYARIYNPTNIGVHVAMLHDGRECRL